MSTQFSMFDPLGAFHAPWSGPVMQRLFTQFMSPNVTVNYKGDAAIEERIVTDVASYGRQLGWLSEIALALAQNRAAPEETVTKLRNAVEEIEHIKLSVRSKALEDAETALNRLADANPSELDALLHRRLRKAETSAAIRNT